MKLIDTHAHIFPAKIEEKAVLAIGDFYNTKMGHKGSIDSLLESGNAIGVEKYLVFSTATTVKQVESINNFIIKQINKYDQFIGLGTMYIDYTDYEKELLRLKDNNIKGIKLHPDFQKFNFDDEKLLPIYDTLSNLGMFVLTHAGDPRYGYSDPERIANIASQFPNLKIIAAHMGGWGQWDKAFSLLPKFENVYYDTSSTYGFSDNDILKKGISVYDKTKIFFGTDFPMWDHKKELDNFLMLQLSTKDIENILYNNFNNFYTDII